MALWEERSLSVGQTMALLPFRTEGTHGFPEGIFSFVLQKSQDSVQVITKICFETFARNKPNLVETHTPEKKNGVSASCSTWKEHKIKLISWTI